MFFKEGEKPVRVTLESVPKHSKLNLSRLVLPKFLSHQLKTWDFHCRPLRDYQWLFDNEMQYVAAGHVQAPYHVTGKYDDKSPPFLQIRMSTKKKLHFLDTAYKQSRFFYLTVLIEWKKFEDPTASWGYPGNSAAIRSLISPLNVRFITILYWSFSKNSKEEALWCFVVG